VQKAEPHAAEFIQPAFIEVPPSAAQPKGGTAMGLQPLSPIETIEYLHWGECAAVTFHRILNRNHDNEEWQELGAITRSDLRWPLIEGYLSRDSYFCVNSTYEQIRAKTSNITGLPIYRRTADSMRWLNALMLDLDIYRTLKNYSFHEVLATFLDDVGRNGLPEPNLICSSGRGIWGLWSLCDHANRSNPVPAYPERRDIYQRVNQALVGRFSHLGADTGCTDPARVIRVPGSVNTKAEPENRVVQFFKLGNAPHTLPEMAGILGVRAQKVQFSGEKRTAPKNEVKVRAGLRRWQIPLEGFRHLWRLRQHFGIGVRHAAVYIYAALLCRNQMCEAEIFEACSRLGAACRPVLSGKDIARCVSSGQKLARKDFRHSIKHSTIGRMLKITDQEKAQLPKWFKPKGPRKADRIAERRKLIELLTAGRSLDGHNPISARQMARLLSESHGIRVSHATVLNDIRVLQEQECSHEHSGPMAGKFSLLIDTGSLSCTSRKNLPAQEAPMTFARTRPLGKDKPTDNYEYTP
jgi:hypothetical protein